MSPISATLALDHIRHRARLRSAWRETAQAVSQAVGELESWYIPNAPTQSLWYKLPVVCRQAPPDFARLQSDLRRHFDVKADPADQFPRDMPELADQLRQLPNWQSLAPRVGTIDLSVEVAKRYRSCDDQDQMGGLDSAEHF